MRFCLFDGATFIATEYSVSFISQYYKVDTFIPFFSQNTAIDILETW